MIYKQYPYLDILFDETFKGVFMGWKGGFVKGDLLKKGLDEGLAFLNQKKTTKWLADTKELGVFTNETQKWINEDWFPRFLSSSARFMAVVVPADALAQMSVNSVMKTADGSSLSVRYFSDAAQASAWLKSC